MDARAREGGGLMHLTANPTVWYVIRASGVVAYVLLSLGAVAGIALAGKAKVPQWPRFAVVDLHRFLGLLVGVFVAIHVGTVAIDSFMPFTVTGLTVPFVSVYRPLWTALGIVAAELLLALALTNRLKSRLPYTVWRRAHFLNFPVWLFATLHGLGSGTDRHALWLLAIELLSVGAVLVALAWRLAPRFPDLARGHLAAGAAGAALIVVLLGSSLPAGASGRGGGGGSVAVPSGSFQETFTGRIQRQNGVSNELVSLSGEGTGSRHVLVRFDLLAANGQLSKSALQLRYAAGGATCTGSVSELDNSAVGGDCTFANGTTVTVRASWDTSDSSSVSGTLAVSA